MDRFRLDYQRQDAPLPRLGLLVFALAVAATIVSVGYYLSLRRQVADWEAKADQAEFTARQHGILAQKRSRGSADYDRQIDEANKALRQLTLPWDQLFETIEAAGSKDVALLSLAPDPEKHTVMISVEAKSINAALDYLRGLEGREIFHNLQVQSHKIQTQDPDKPIRLTLQATWKGLP